MGIDFANPAMLFGALLFGVPLIIHLLNRRRYQIKSWAAMSFLLRAYKRTRRRLRLEHFLLLLVRCLIIALLAAAMARPFVPSDSLFSGLSEKSRNVIVVLDRSYSMGYRDGPGETAFERAISRIKRLVRTLDSGRGDTCAFMVAGREAEFVVPLSSLPEDVLVKVENPEAAPLLREPSQGGAHLASLAALLAGEVADQARGGAEVFVFTDMQTRFFGGAADAGDREDSSGRAPGGSAALLTRAVEKGVSVRFVDVTDGVDDGDSIRPNLAVTDIVALDQNITTNSIASFSATITNFGDDDIRGLTGSFVLDGKVAEKRTVDIRARGRATVELSRSFRDSGFHTLSFRLASDNLPVDDERFLAIEARESIDVLLVDGAWDYDPFERPTGVVGMMLNPLSIMEGGSDLGGADPAGEEGAEEDRGTPAAGTVFNPTTIDFKLLNAGREDPGRYDCVFLADVEGLSDGAADTLFDFVSSGGRLVFFMGERVDLHAWNLRLFDDPERRLLPARLARMEGSASDQGRTSFYKLTARSFDHPVLRVFDDPRLKVLLEVPVFRFVAIELDTGTVADADGGAADSGTAADRGAGADADKPRVVARFADPLGNSFPAIVEQRIGRGRVMLFTTSADASWSMIAESPKTYLPLLHETVYYLATRDPGIYNLAVGETITRTVTEFPDRIALTTPGDSENVIAERVENSQYGRFVLPLQNNPLERAGSYVLEVDSSVSGKRLRECYSANVDYLEGDLRKMDESSLLRIYPGVTVGDGEGVGESEEEGDSSGGELWKTVLWALLGLVALELILSWKFGDYS